MFGAMTSAPGEGLYHAVQIGMAESGPVGGKVLQAFEPVPGRSRFSFRLDR
jgi:hypothetical protein